MSCVMAASIPAKTVKSSLDYPSVWPKIGLGDYGPFVGGCFAVNLGYIYMMV